MKKKTGTRVKSTVFVLLLLMGASFVVVATGTVSAAQDGNYTYTLSGSPAVAMITGYTGTGGAITIPSTLGGYSVVAIGDPAGVDMPFYGITSLTSVIMPNSVTSIGKGAFALCSGLISVTMTGNLKTIGPSAFESCTSLTSVSIPNSVTSIGDHAFRTCTSMTSVSIGSGVTSIGYAAFYECAKLTSVTIPNSVTSIGDYAFGFCDKMTSVTIGSSVTSIGEAAFSDCTSLNSITFLGLVAPTTVGSGWLSGTYTNLRGHAHTASNFPPYGIAWNGLIMGTSIESGTPASDNTGLIGLVSAFVLIAILVLFQIRKDRKKKAAGPPPYPPMPGNANGPGNYQGQVPQGNQYQPPPQQYQQHQPPPQVPPTQYQPPAQQYQAPPPQQYQPPPQAPMSPPPMQGPPLTYCSYCGAPTTGGPICSKCGRNVR